MEETFTTTEAAEMLGVSAARIRQMVLAGDIKGEKRGRDLLIPKSQIEKARARKTKPGPKSAKTKKEVKKK
jgi:excisionase family DNA binding protein